MDSPISPAFLFRFSLPCRKSTAIRTQPLSPLTPKYFLPTFRELEGFRPFAELRGAWHSSGLSFQVEVRGKKRALWCRESRMEDSDGLFIWIDTRNTQNVHRATQFCHLFGFLPTSERGIGVSVARQLTIPQSKQQPKPAPEGTLQANSQVRAGGYRLQAHIAAQALTGFDPAEHSRLGFYYAVVDQELGVQSLSVGPEYRFHSPSIWGTLELAN